MRTAYQGDFVGTEYMRQEKLHSYIIFYLLILKFCFIKIIIQIKSLSQVKQEDMKMGRCCGCV